MVDTILHTHDARQAPKTMMRYMIPPNEPENGRWLPHAKLALGIPLHNTLVRNRLLAVLHQAISRFRVTLVSAPPGYGKSTLLGSWLQLNHWLVERATGEQAEMTPVNAAYLSLDGSENDRAHFLLALIAALQTLHPACGQRAKAFLTANGYPAHLDAAIQVQILSGLIVIDIAQYLPDRFAIILDNYERIAEQTVHEALNYLLRRLPPQAHVVVSTTQDPPVSLTRLRAHGMVIVLRADDLAFEEQESVAFLDKVLELEWPALHYQALHQYTEGWPIGLLLAAQELAMLPNEATRARFVADHAKRTQNPIVLPATMSYFREEVFRHLPRPLKTFLMQTSILFALRPESCQAVTGRQDAESMLQEIHRRNLFVQHMTGNGLAQENPSFSPMKPIYRYHKLFAAFLRSELAREMAGQIPRLHRLAAEAEIEPVYKICHYLSAHCWEKAAQTAAAIDDDDLSVEARATLSYAAAAIPAPVLHSHPGLLALNAKWRHRPSAAQSHGLTTRQLEVLALLDNGASNRAIAESLVIALPTVKEHISQIMRKLEVTNRRAAVQRAAELGLLSS